jgi:hypothetical protein
MKQADIINGLDPDALGKMGSRRDVIRKLGAGAALAAFPAAFAMMAKKAFAQAADPTPTEVLNFALTLEFLEAEFYNIGMGTSGLIPSMDRTIFGTLQDHENAHVEFLQAALGNDAVSSPTFDFTADGAFDPFGDYAQFQALSLAFEDTGVRAYKGGAPFLMGTDFLTPALTIHSVEARHAAEVRRLRVNFTEVEPDQGWVTEKNRGTGMPEATQPVYEAGSDPAMYPAEDNTTHGGVDVSALTYDVDIADTSFSESYDEPLDMDTVNAIAGLFIE